MGKLYGMKQRRAAEYWDTLFQGVGNMTVGNNTVMFQARHTGQKHLSNLQAAGQFPSDNTFVTLALSCTIIYYNCRFTAVVAPAARDGAGAVSQNPADLQFTTEMFTLTRKQLLFIYRVGEKDSYDALCDAWPAAQGASGAVALAAQGASEDQDVAQGFINNGTTDYGSLLRLGKPEVVAARQHFEVEARFANLPSANPAPAAPPGGGAPPNVLNYINAANPTLSNGSQDFKHCSVRILGVHTRDVQ